MAAKILKGKEECCLSGLTDDNSAWCCLRLEFLTRYYLEFKRIMRDTVDSHGEISLTTNQPKNVSLYQGASEAAIFLGSITGLENWCF